MQTKTILAFCCGLCLVASEAFSQHVEIRFRGSELSLANELVRLQDVAELTGGDPVIRQKLANLDVESFRQDQTSIDITAEIVRYRILLAGISDSRFHIEPGSSTRVTHLRPEKINRMIEQSILWQCLEMYRVPEEELEFTLLSKLDAALLRAGLELNSINVVSELPADLPLGQRNIPITVSDAQGRSLKLNAVCRVTVFREVALVRTPVARGEALSERNIERVRRPINGSAIQLASYEEVIGKTAQTNLQAYSVVNQQAIRPRAVYQSPAAQFDVKRNAIVSLVIRQGNLYITLKNARANQNGRIGETIPFTNPATNKIIYAKIVDANTASIEQ
jgi:flagella basal body P-ring formation protein FlgA